MLTKNLGHPDPQISSNSIQLENLKKYEWIRKLPLAGGGVDSASRYCIRIQSFYIFMIPSK